jgi:hypothetical protein
MPSPLNLSSARVVDPILTTIAQGYRQAEFVGDRLFPRVPVSARGGKILEFGKEAFQRYASRRAPGARTARIEWGYAGKPFALYQDSLEAPVPREIAQDAAAVPGIDLGRGAVSTVMRSLLMTQEIDQATLATTASNYETDSVLVLTGAGKWSTDTGTPITDIDNAREVIRRKCGLYPNIVTLSAKAFNAARNNKQVLARVLNGGKNAEPAQVTKEALATLWNVDDVVVGAGIYMEGGNSLDIWGNDVVLAYVPKSMGGGAMDLAQPSYGYTYTLNGNPMVEVPYFEQQSKSWIYGVTFERAPVLSGIASGFLIKGAA